MTNEMITINEIKEMAKISYASKLFQMPNVESMATLMMLCQSEGIHPLQALKRYHIIKGRPSMKADAMLAEFQRAGGKVKWLDRSDKSCSAEFTHESGGTVKVEWTIDMAKKAQLLSNPTWSKYPRQMLTARVISEGIRTVFPAIITGIYTPEEVSDFDVKATPVVSKPKPATKPQPKVEKPKPETKATEAITDAEVVEPILKSEKVDTAADKSEKPAKEPTGAQVAADKKKIRDLCIKVGCKTQADMKAKTKEILGTSPSTLTATQRAKMIASLEKEVADA